MFILGVLAVGGGGSVTENEFEWAHSVGGEGVLDEP